MVLNLTSELIGVFLGGLVGLFIGIGNTYYAKNLDEKRDREYVVKVVMSEIEINQALLTNIVNLMKIAGAHLEKIKLSEQIMFDVTVYSVLLDRIGLLEQNDYEKTIQYYNKIKKIENQLKIVHENMSYTGMTDDQIKLIKQSQTKEYFKLAEEAYELGKKLLKILN